MRKRHVSGNVSWRRRYKTAILTRTMQVETLRACRGELIIVLRADGYWRGVEVAILQFGSSVGVISAPEGID